MGYSQIKISKTSCISEEENICSSCLAVSGDFCNCLLCSLSVSCCQLSCLNYSFILKYFSLKKYQLSLWMFYVCSHNRYRNKKEAYSCLSWNYPALASPLSKAGSLYGCWQSGLGCAGCVSSVKGIKFRLCTEHGLKVSDFTDKKKKANKQPKRRHLFFFRTVDTWLKNTG